MKSDKNNETIKNSIELSTTSNSWINNGLINLAQEFQTNFETVATVKYNNDKIEICSDGDQKLDDLLCNALHNIAARGTYNISTTLKILNQHFNSNYSSKLYPDSKEDFDATIEITGEESQFLKKQKRDSSKKQKVWRQRSSYLSNKKNYLDKGLNLKADKKFVQAVFDNGNKNRCPVCGSKTGKLINMQQQFNPLTTEHHNNEIEGFNFSSMGRKNSQACHKCLLLCYFSLFNKNVPFFQVPQKDTYLSIPNVMDLEILRKVHNNLSLPNQSIDFNDATCKSYSSNIKSLFHISKNACLLALLHNIKNEYSKTKTEKLTMSFEMITRDEFSEVIEWLFISKNFRITHIKADEKVYDVLEKSKDPKNNDDIYLVPDFLTKFSFNRFDVNIIDRFFEGILKLEPKKIADGLFHMAKISAVDSSKIYQHFRSNGSSPLLLFEKVFLPKIVEVNMMLNDELNNACRDLAKSIGKGFSKDIGMMTKFAYASSLEDFKMALEEAVFRLAKKSALKDESNYVSEDSLKILFDSLNTEQFPDIKNNFVSFMSVAVISKNYQSKGGN